MPPISVRLADLAVLHPLGAPQRWDCSGSQAAPPGKPCAVTSTGTNFPPFTEHLCPHHPAGTRDWQARNDSTAEKGWEAEVYMKLCGYREAQVTTLSLVGGTLE